MNKLGRVLVLFALVGPLAGSAHAGLFGPSRDSLKALAIAHGFPPDRAGALVTTIKQMEQRGQLNNAGMKAMAISGKPEIGNEVTQLTRWNKPARR